MHGGFDADRFPISWWAVEDDSALPRDTQAVVRFACFGAEEIGGYVLEIVFQGGWENDVLPAGLLHGAVERGVFLPVALVEDPDLAVERGGPVADVLDHSVDGRLSGGEDVLDADYWVGVCAVTAVD